MRSRFALISVSAILLAAYASAPTGAQQPPAVAPTFTKDVAPILFKNCVNCHRPGEAAPMSLLTYESARPFAKAIANAIDRRTMPPWHADAPAGTFHNERILTDAERKTLVAWAGDGAPRGEERDLPPAPTFTEGWSLGKPDIVLEMLEDYRLPATGTVQYEWFYIPTNFSEAKWVKSIEVRPGDRAAVHHVLVYYRAKPDRSARPLLEPTGNIRPIPRPTSKRRRTAPAAGFGGYAAAARRHLCARYKPASRAGRNSIPSRAWRNHRTSDALHSDREAGL